MGGNTQATSRGGGNATGMGGRGGVGATAGGFAGDGSGGGGRGTVYDGDLGTFLVGGAGGNFGQGGQSSAGGGGGGGVGGGGGTGGGSLGGGGGGGGGFGGGGGATGGGGFMQSTAGGAGGFGGGGGGAGGNGNTPGIPGFGGGSGSAGGPGASMGGAVFNHQGELVIRNTTLSGNVANLVASGAGLGGAVFNLNGIVEADSATFAFNSADHGDSLYNLAYDSATARVAQATLVNTILSDGAGSGAEVVSNSPATVSDQAANLGTASVDASQPNLIESSQELGGGTITGSPITLDPGLGPLQPNGGSTPTHAIGATSPTFDQGSTTLASDQRGITRPQGSIDDIGAFEREQLPPDSDGDGVPDASDECDDLGASTASGCPAVARSLTLAYSARKETFKGRLSSTTPACADTIEVEILRKVAGSDKTVATTTTGATGKYKATRKPRKGKYYATVGEDVIADLAQCEPMTSPVENVG